MGKNKSSKVPGTTGKKTTKVDTKYVADRYLITPIVRKTNAKGQVVDEVVLGNGQGQQLVIFDHELENWIKKFRRDVAKGAINPGTD